jgi:hypothetical protein
MSRGSYEKLSDACQRKETWQNYLTQCLSGHSKQDKEVTKACFSMFEKEYANLVRQCEKDTAGSSGRVK